MKGRLALLSLLLLFLSLSLAGALPEWPVPARAAQRVLKPGKIVVRGRWPKRSRRAGKKTKTFYQVSVGRNFRLAAGGPVRLVLLVRGLRRGQATFTLVKGTSQASVTVDLHPAVSRGMYIALEAGTNLVLVKADRDFLVRPVKVRRRPLPSEQEVKWQPATPPAAAARQPAPPSPPGQGVGKKATGEADKPALPALPPLVPTPAPEKPVVSPVAKKPVAATTPQTSPAPPTTGKPIASPLPPAGQEKPAARVQVERRVVGEKRISAKPPLDPSGVSMFGQRGLWRVWSSRSYQTRSVVVSSSVEFFKSSGFITSGDSNQRLQGRLVAAGVPLPGLEINAGFSIISNQNTSFDPSESQSIGDPFLGVRYGYQLTNWFALGAGLQSVFPTGRKFSQLSTEGISTRILFAFDFMPLPESLISLNIGYHFDNSKRIFDYPLNPAQQFAAGIYPHDQLLLGLGVAWQFGPVAPFLEYGSALALGASDMGFSDSPNWLTLGVRVWPLRFHDFQILAAADIGLSATGGSESAPTRTPPYNIILSVSYDFGSTPPPDVVEREVVRVEKKEMPCRMGSRPTGAGSRVVGRVVDADTGKPIGSVRVVMGGKEPAIFLSDPEQGRFFTCPMSPGPVRLRVYRDGYREDSQVVLVSDRPETPVTIRMVRTGGVAHGTVKGTVRSVTGLTLPALISVPARNVSFRAQRNGSFSHRLETGSFDVLISMPGYVTQRRKVKLEVELYPKK